MASNRIFLTMIQGLGSTLWGIGALLGLYKENGEENGSYNIILGYILSLILVLLILL